MYCFTPMKIPASEALEAYGPKTAKFDEFKGKAKEELLEAISLKVHGANGVSRQSSSGCAGGPLHVARFKVEIDK